MGVLFARVGGAWVPISGTSDEVFIGPDDPIGTFPMTELWYDTDAPGRDQPSFGLEANKPAAPGQPMSFFATDTKREWFYDGTGWIVMAEPTQSGSAVFGGVTLGTGGTAPSSYHRQDGYCDWKAGFTLGSSGFTVGALTHTLTFPAQRLSTNELNVAFVDSGGWRHAGLHDPATSGAMTLYFARADLPGAIRNEGATTSATAPFTWGAGDATEISGRYQMASRYT